MRSRLAFARISLSKSVLVAACLFALVGGIARTSWGLGEEDFGNAKVFAGNYKDWPGVMPMLDDDHRVYRNWVNGNESFYYDGDVKALNASLVKFGQIKNKDKRVVLLGGQGECRSFEGKEMKYAWRLHLLGGIAKAVFERENEPPIYDLAPTVYIHLHPKMDLDEIRIPNDVKAVGIESLRKRYYAGIEKGSRRTRGYAAYFLSDLDPHHAESAARVAMLLKDDDDWTISMACTCLKRYGVEAKPFVAELKNAKSTESIREAIQSLESATPRAEEAAAVREADARIAKWLSARQG